MAIQIPSKANLDAIAAQIAAIQADTSAALALARAGSGLIDDGETTIPRLGVVANFAPVANNTHYSYFTAARTETITKIKPYGRTTAAVGTTDARLAVYEHDVDANTLTRLAVTANDTTLWSAANARTEVPLLTPFNKVSGKRYAVAMRITATTMPNFFGRQGEPGQNVRPYLNGYSFGTDVPVGPFTAVAGASGNTFNIYYELLR